MSIKVINPADKFTRIHEYWNPHVAARLNGQCVKLAKIKGEFIRHHHEAEDELFMVIYGELFIELEDETLCIKSGEFVVIPRGVEHRPYAPHETGILLFEPETTLNTGNVIDKFTRNKLEDI